MANKEIKTNLDLQGNEIKNYCAEKVATDPTTNLFAGRRIYNTTDNIEKVYDGSNWVGQDLSGLMVKSQNLSDVASRQTALNNITNVTSATDEYVLTKDTVTGDAIFKPSVGGGSASTIATTATTGGTTTLTASSANIQRFTGTAGQILVLPDATTLTNAKSFDILNDCTTSTGAISIRTNGGAYLTLVPQTGKATIILEDNGTTAGVWSVEVSVPNISGLTIINSANSFTAGQYLTNGASTYVLAKSDLLTTIPCVARVVSANANQYAIFTSGVCSTNLGLDSGLTANTSYIISNITAGAVIAYPATPSDGQLIQSVLEASSATSGVFNPLTVSTWNVSANSATSATQGVVYLSKPITIANNATDANNDIDFFAGNFQFSDGSGQAVATAMTKRLDATWTAGTNQGGLLNGTAVPKAINSTYHCFKIYNPTTGVEDSAFLRGISGTAPDPTSVLPSGFTKFDRRGSITTDGSGNIRPFTQLNINEFYYASDISETNSIGTPNTNNLLPITTPLGISTKAMITARLVAATPTGAYTYTIFSPIAQGNKGIIIGAGTQADTTQVLQREICTDTSSRIYQNGSTYASLSGGLYTTGYIDYTL